MSQQSPDESLKAIDITGDNSDSDHGMTNCWVKIDKFHQTERYSRIVKHGLMIMCAQFLIKKQYPNNTAHFHLQEVGSLKPLPPGSNHCKSCTLMEINVATIV